MKSRRWRVIDLPVDEGEIPFKVSRIDGMNNKASVVTMPDGSLYLISYDTVVAYWRIGETSPRLTVAIDSGFISATTIRHVKRFVEICESRGFKWELR